jgi:hypothetical protein
MQVLNFADSECISYYPTNTTVVSDCTIYIILFAYIQHKRDVSPENYTWPNQLNLWALMSVIIFLFLIWLFNLPFVLILRVPPLSFVGLNIILNIFLSVIKNFHFIDSFSTHVLLEYVITGLTVVQYNLFWLPLIPVCFKYFLICIISFKTPIAVLSLISSSIELSALQTVQHIYRTLLALKIWNW